MGVTVRRASWRTVQPSQPKGNVMKTSHILGITMVVAASSGLAFAANDARDPYENSSSTWTRNMQAQLQRGVEQRASRTIALDTKQKWVTVQHLESVKLIDARGQSFVWQAGAPASFPLKAIAPAGFDSANVWVAVMHPKDHVAK